MNQTELEQTFIAKCLKRMVQKGGSDLYITSGVPVSARINGIIVPITENILTPANTEDAVTGCMNKKQYHEFMSELHANFSLHIEGSGRFRINAFRQKCNAGIVARHINAEIPTIEKLGLPDIFSSSVMQKHGLVLIVGPTGSGKSTTLAAMVNHRNQSEPGHIITIEDPIEFVHQHGKGIITQREIGTDTPCLHDAIMDVLREDPDVVLVGEIRDKQTMEQTLSLSNTGHLCLATLHANNAMQAIDRMVRLFPAEERESARVGVSENLVSIFSQRLIKNKTGKRSIILDIMSNTPHISDMIQKDNSSGIYQDMMNGSEYGMQTFDAHLVQLVRDDVIDHKTALTNADHENWVRMQLKAMRGTNSGADLELHV